jgi:diacylglycerol kinase (ATP)
MKILFVLNPVSGGTSNDKTVLEIHRQAIATRSDFKFHYTCGEGDLGELERQIMDYKPDRVVAGGGDGTVQLVGKALLQRNIPMAILPLGSANGLATALGIPQDPEGALEVVFHSQHLKPLDVLHLNGEHYCMHLADMGINAMMVKNYTEEGDRGMMGYARHLLHAIKESPLLKYTVRTPEQTYAKEGYMVAFANAHMYGTGIHISEGSVSDGKFEICNVEDIALDAAIKAGLTRFNVFVDKDMFSDVISCHEAVIDIDQPVDFQIDGEYMGKTDHLEISTLSSALRVIMPEP